MGTGALSRGQNGGDVKLTTPLYLVPRFGMTEPLLYFPLHAFLVWAGKNLPFCLYLYETNNL
jgi:hypothetical protein